VGFICIGAGLDFLVGAQVRAPSLMQKYGMEWFWRLATNPRRLALRYARCAIVLAEIAIVDPLKARVFGRSS
jgi:UDP-N-acetyl-D-mannosaminuronic acid transferase (WecB/TagA/CpsF family)